MTMTDKTCRTCCRPIDDPFRFTDDDGTIRAGCVVEDHDEYADAWHNRPEAVAIRQANRDRLAKLFS